MYPMNVEIRLERLWHTYMAKMALRVLKKNEQLQRYMDMLEERNIPMSLCSVITDELFSLRAEAKVKWVAENYGYVLQNCCVKDYRYKSLACKVIMDFLDCDMKEILIIDDNWDVLIDCYDKGFSVCTPLHIVNYVNDLTSSKSIL